MALKIQLYLEHQGGELHLWSTRFWAHAEQGSQITSEMNSVGSGLTGQPLFQWNRGQKALCILLLRAFAQDDPTQHPGLCGGSGSLARALVEVLGDKYAKTPKDERGRKGNEHEPTWIEVMFRGYPDAKKDIDANRDPRLPVSLFNHHGNADRGTFRLSLGREWKGAELEVMLDHKAMPEPRTNYVALAEELEREPSPLHVEVLVAPPGSQSLSDFRLMGRGVPPVHGGDLVRIRVVPRRAAFLYVCWITPEGLAEPQYPWAAPQWDRRVVKKEQKQPRLELPLTKLGWEFDKRAGLETLVVLARRTSALKTEDEEALRKQLGALPKTSKSIGIPPGPFEFDMCQSAGLRLRYEGDDPVMARHMSLAQRLRVYCDAGRCLSFLNAGTLPQPKKGTKE